MHISLANIHLASAQEVFDQVATHLLTQNKRSLFVRQIGTDTVMTASCRYKADNLRCAAGCLISDEEYNITCEGNDWTGVLNLYMFEYDAFPLCDAHKQLVLCLQRIHDALPI